MSEESAAQQTLTGEVEGMASVCFREKEIMKVNLRNGTLMMTTSWVSFVVS